MKAGEIYIKIGQSTQVVNRKVLLRDVAELYSADSELVKKVGRLPLITFKGDKEEKIVFSVVKIIEMIQKVQVGLSVINLGEIDFIVEYKFSKKPQKVWDFLKLVFLSLIVFFGAAFTVMTFNTDVSVSDVFDNLYYLVMGQEKEGGSLLELSYCVGIPIGVLGFYNHFKMDSVRNDPTPIHVEMRTYEENRNKALIKDASRENREKEAEL